MRRNNPHRRALLKTSGAGLGLALLAGRTQAKTTAGMPTELRIDTGWQMRQAGKDDWIAATVPGTVHTDLLAAGRIADPFYRTNERDQQWIDKVDWEYRTTLELDAKTLAHDHIELVFAGLDTYAEVWLNDVLVLSADNMFREWTADIKPQVKAGANALRILFRSPITEGLKRLDALGYNPPAPNDQSENGGLGDKRVSVFTRKAGYHYGWDWGPRFVTSGLWRPVTLRAWSGARICDLQVVQDSLTKDQAALTIMFEIMADQAGPAVIDLSSETDGAIRARQAVTLVKGVNTVPLKVAISKPKLWWTNGLGEAHLYSLTGRVVTASATDSRTVTTGLRTIKIVQTPDADGSSFYVELNGVPVFMKGANYIPNDSFLPRVTHEVYDRVVQSAVDTHMNMLRVWGGGTYEEDYFYDLCDHNGILVWQDFMFACSMYPGDAAFLENVRQEAIYNVRRLRNHPSIALWVGNNEIDAAWQNDVPEGGWGWKQKYTQSQRDEMWAGYQAVFLDILPKVVAEHDGQRFYWPSSPQAAWDKHSDISQPKQSGDIHYWDVWWGQKPFADYRTHIGRFMSEYGFQSFPEFRTVQAYAKPEDYDIFSEVMAAHQRSSIGNGTIKNYMQRDYVVPADFQQFLYVGQVLQAEGIKVAMEAHRARMPYCMGSLFWQINDCWPVASWSSIDYFGRWKAQQYFARKAFDTVLVSPVLDGDKVTVTVVSDYLKDRVATLEIRTMDFKGEGGRVQTVPLTLKANRAEAVFTGNVAGLLNGLAPENALLHVRLMDADQLLSENITYFKPVKDLALPNPAIESRVKPLERAVAVTVTSPVLVKNLCLGFDGHDGVFSDNFFDLLPGQTRIITFTPRGSAPVASDLTLRHMMS
ncbi:beta-mannosidase [Asticcacaulis taihuensis]|uniref:beta-mannosidase n=1 Tax=Asticcacaulis taihuensis TaxID=260084 RepID=UPI0026F1E932|nr:glycoside hydrolase family 2 protein [Asticcacaulis taihuensis]